MSKAQTELDRAEESLRRGIENMTLADPTTEDAPAAAKAHKTPLFTRDALQHLLRELECEQHYAEGEADSPTAELAQQLGGYVVSNGPSLEASRLNMVWTIVLMSYSFVQTATTLSSRPNAVAMCRSR